MEALTSQHHITIEEIARLERERDAINRRIQELRATLPKVAPVTVVVSEGGRSTTMRVPSQQVSPQQAMAGPVAAKEPRISDHAVIAFLERRYGFDFNGIRKELLSDTVRMAIRMGAQGVKADGGKFVIRDHVVVSFVPAHDSRSNKARREARKRR